MHEDAAEVLRLSDHHASAVLPNVGIDFGITDDLFSDELDLRRLAVVSHTIALSRLLPGLVEEGQSVSITSLLLTPCAGTP